MKIMRKTLTFLLVAFIIIGCSSNDDLENNTELIIGKWNLDSRFSENGTNENLDECEKRTNITFKVNNTFDLDSYRTINNDCVLEDEDENIEYKLENGILEITFFSTNNSGQTIVDVNKVKMTFINSNTFELSNIDNSNNDSSKEIWKRTN